MFDWITDHQAFLWLTDHQGLLWIIGAVSVALFIATLFIMPAILVRIRPDYFAHDERPASTWIIRSPTLRIGLRIGKNVLGVVLMLAGLAMLLLPGQGLLTLLIGFMMVDFPGKYRWERWLFERPTIRRAVNWLRVRAGRVPLMSR
jgi:hypothetical protein